MNKDKQNPPSPSIRKKIPESTTKLNKILVIQSENDKSSQHTKNLKGLNSLRRKESDKSNTKSIISFQNQQKDTNKRPSDIINQMVFRDAIGIKYSTLTEIEVEIPFNKILNTINTHMLNINKTSSANKNPKSFFDNKEKIVSMFVSDQSSSSNLIHIEKKPFENYDNINLSNFNYIYNPVKHVETSKPFKKLKQETAMGIHMNNIQKINDIFVKLKQQLSDITNTILASSQTKTNYDPKSGLFNETQKVKKSANKPIKIKEETESLMDNKDIQIETMSGATINKETNFIKKIRHRDLSIDNNIKTSILSPKTKTSKLSIDSNYMEINNFKANRKEHTPLSLHCSINFEALSHKHINSDIINRIIVKDNNLFDDQLQNNNILFPLAEDYANNLTNINKNIIIDSLVDPMEGKKGENGRSLNENSLDFIEEQAEDTQYDHNNTQNEEYPIEESFLSNAFNEKKSDLNLSKLLNEQHIKSLQTIKQNNPKHKKTNTFNSLTKIQRKITSIGSTSDISLFSSIIKQNISHEPQTPVRVKQQPKITMNALTQKFKEISMLNYSKSDLQMFSINHVSYIT